MPVTEHDDLFARVVEWQHSTDPDTWRATKLITDLAVALRAALAARPQPLFEGPVDKLTVWLRDQDRNPDPMIVPEWWSGVVLYPAVAGSATPTEHGVQIVLAHGLDCEGCQRVNDELSDDELVLYLRRGIIHDFQAQAVDRLDELAAEVVRLRAAAGSKTPTGDDDV